MGSQRACELPGGALRSLLPEVRRAHRAQDTFKDAQALEQGTERARVHAKAGEAYVAAWRGCSLEVQGEDLGCAGAAQVVPRMVESFGEAQRPDRHIHALLIARDRRWRADSAAGDAALNSAAEKAEQSAANHPDAASLEAIRMAAYARIAVGQAPLATKLIGTYRKQAAKTDQENVFALHIALGTGLNDAEKHVDAQRALGAQPSKAPERISILWLSESGRAAAGMNRPQSASQFFNKALQSWQGLPEGVESQGAICFRPFPAFGRGFPWVSIGFYGFPWVFMGFHGFPEDG